MGFSSRRTFRKGARSLAVVLLMAGPVLAASPAPTREEIARGKELFHREWIPNDTRSAGGDGVGPVFNDTSCIACHNLGASGGAGPSSKNVDILSAVLNRQQDAGQRFKAQQGQPPALSSAQSGASAKPPAPNLDELIESHPGFRTARSVVLHRFGSDPNYQSWRLKLLGQGSAEGFGRSGTRSERADLELAMVRSLAVVGRLGIGQAQIGDFALFRSQRNPTALFGSGLIDAIPDEVLEAKGRERYPKFPEIHGRVRRLKGGGIGRFGWKSQTANLKDFVLTACAVELGLDVPDHPQAGIPFAPAYRSPGQDLDARQCAALVAFVGSLPPPGVREPAGMQETRALAVGKADFELIGCAACHSPKLGDVDGIFSDLLLHNMGPELGDTGSYGVFVPDAPDQGPVDLTTPLADEPQGHGRNQATPVDKSKVVGAMRLEWRTPPLWGIRDSGPYLHDGRAETLDEAIAHHGGEARETARRYFQLIRRDRLQIQAFLKSLVAPTAQVARLENPADK